MSSRLIHRTSHLSPSARVALAWLVGGASGVVALASCGARTGLDLGDDVTTTNVDSGRDGSLDASEDADAAPVGCTPGTVSLTSATPTVMFVLDRSGSMGDQLGRTVNGTRWDILTTSLASTLPPVDKTMSIGALLFPTASVGGAQSCSAPGSADLSPALGHVDALISLMRQNQPNGGTPTADALSATASYLLNVRAATSARAMVLATDGEPNCNSALNGNTCTCVESTRGCARQPNQCLDDTRTVQRLASFESEGLPTYVIGLEDTGNARFSSVLDAMAIAGGRPQTGGAHSYYSANSPEDLDSALVTIRDQVGACTFLTTSVPDSRGTIVITLSGVTIPFDATKTNGWDWANQNNGEIALYGAACTAAGLAGAAALDANVTCGTDGGVEGGSDATLSDSAEGAPPPDATAPADAGLAD